MAGDKAGNGPPRPEEGPATIIDPGDTLADALDNNSHVAPPCNTCAQAAAGDAPPRCQAGGQVQADHGDVFPTISPKQIPTNPTIPLCAAKTSSPAAPDLLPCGRPGRLPSPY
ncbi:hypothetical protein LIER_24794 [Lithospermum erythrorhizon]|uniref:Uncharacterized protein n=1 Tax=Lithospermum erythrorhizon TaxID=34254 RepID=A0AAV3R2I7_LITER